MSVNTMDINDVYQVLNDLHEQATGQKAIAPTDTASFVSMANTTLQAGTDVVFNALMQMVSRTIFSIRPYSRKFGGLERSAEEWGAIVRKISIADTPAEQDEAYGRKNPEKKRVGQHSRLSVPLLRRAAGV